MRVRSEPEVGAQRQQRTKSPTKRAEAGWRARHPDTITGAGSGTSEYDCVTNEWRAYGCDQSNPGADDPRLGRQQRFTAAFLNGKTYFWGGQHMPIVKQTAGTAPVFAPAIAGRAVSSWDRQLSIKSTRGTSCPPESEVPMIQRASMTFVLILLAACQTSPSRMRLQDEWCAQIERSQRSSGIQAPWA